MKNLTTVVLLVAVCIGCSSKESSDVAFITKLGSDTLAIETFTKTENGIEAKVVLRSPQTVLTSYELVQDEFGGVQKMTATRFNEASGFEGSGTFQQSIEREGDSLFTQYRTRSGDLRSYKTKYQEGALPFIDMVHWPFELALIQANSEESDTVNQKMLSGNNISNFVIANLGGASRTIRHPSRGVMDVEVNHSGELVLLDAAQTTRKLIVSREAGTDINSIAERFLRLDKEGKSFGSLSGAVEEEFVVSGASFKVTYGSPSRRGRDLFGGIVPWGERWRTGANRATHFSTSKELMIGDLKVPAGDYTLFTIPEAEGGTLIINKQTGQNGRTYDEARDLGRVPMQLSTKADNTESFTITVEENEIGGELNLIWGESVFKIPFQIK
ncbi:MAG: DUF2911 domain-containing protein [Balneolaceae bacterium]